MARERETRSKRRLPHLREPSYAPTAWGETFAVISVLATLGVIILWAMGFPLTEFFKSFSAEEPVVAGNGPAFVAPVDGEVLEEEEEPEDPELIQALDGAELRGSADSDEPVEDPPPIPEETADDPPAKPPAAVAPKTAREKWLSDHPAARDYLNEEPEINLTIDRNFDIHMRLLKVPPGTLMMGRTEAERRAANAATDGLMHNASAPQHEVKIREPFYMGCYEVSNLQFYYFVRHQHRKMNVKLPEGYLKNLLENKDMPVAKVSWIAARYYCDWLSNRTGMRVRLPTEVEWEWAARGPKGDKFAGKFEKSSEPRPVTEAWGETSWCGIANMSGNVGEWCVDVFDEEAYFKASQEEHNWHMPSQMPAAWDTNAGTQRVYRGGGFYDSSLSNCEAATRRWKQQNSLKPYIGFRVVVTGLVQQPPPETTDE